MKKGFTTFLSALKANTPPPREKRYSSLKFLSIFLILFLAVGNVWGQETVIIGSNSGAFTLESNHEVAGYSGGTNSSTLTSASDGFGASKGSKLGSTSNIGSKLSTKNHIRFKIDAGEKVRFYYYQTSGTNKETTFATSDYSQSANYYHTPTPYTAAQKNTLYYVDFEFTTAGTYAISVTSGQSVYAAGLLFTPSAPATTPVTTVTIDGGENAYVGVTKTLSATTDVAATEYKWEVDGVDQEVNAATFDFTPAADGTYNVVCKARNEYNDAGAYVSSSVLQITAGKLCGELIKATHTAETTATVEGVLGGTVDKKTQSGGKLGSNDHYFGVKLAAGNFQPGDVVTIYASTVSSKVQIFSDKGTTMINEGVFDGNYYTYTLTEATEWIYLYRTSSEGSSMNPTLGYISVSRSCETSTDCEIKSLTINGEAITPSAKVYSYEVPALSALTEVAVAYSIHPLATGTPASGFTVAVPTAGDPANTQTITVTAEDGTTSDTYTVSISKATAASDVVTLDALAVTGYTLDPTFDAATLAYTITKAYGAEDPTSDKVTYTKSEEAQTVDVVYDGTNHKFVITVTAEDNTTTQDYEITINEAEAPKSLSRVLFSNGFDAFIDNTNHTVKAYYLAGATAPTATTITAGAGTAGEYAEDKITVTGEDASTVDYIVTLEAVTPNTNTVAAEAEAGAFDGTEAWVKNGLLVYGNAAGYDGTNKRYTNRRLLKSSDAADDQRVIAGWVRSYFFVGNAYKFIMTVSNNTAIKYSIDGGEQVVNNAATVEITLPAGNHMIEIVSNQSNGDCRLSAPKLVERPETYSVTYQAGEGTGASIVDDEAITVAGCPVSFVNEGYLFAGWKDESDNDVAVGSAVASDMILTAQWVINPCPDRKSLSKIVLTSATEGNVTGYNSNEYAGEAVIAALDGTEVADLDGDSNNEIGYKLNSGGKSILFATLSKGFFQTGDEVVVGITKANDQRTISDSKAIMTIYAGSDKDNTIELGTLTNVDKAGYYTYALTEADITAINAAGYKSVGLFRASENGQNHYVYSVEITGCRSWAVFHTLTFKNIDGTETIAAEPLEEGAAASTVAPAAPKIPMKRFLGWAEAVDGTLVDDLTSYTITDDKTLYAVYENIVCPTTGTVYKFEIKDELSSENLPTSTDKDMSSYINATGDAYLTYTATANNKAIINSDGTIQLKDATAAYLKVELECALAAGDQIRAHVTNNPIRVQVGTTYESSNDLILAKNVYEFVGITSAMEGKQILYITRSTNGNANLADFEIYRPAKYTVTFDMMGHGSAIADIENVLEGSKISAPTAPTDADYSFAGWYKESTLENEWDFDVDVVEANTTLYAKWLDKSDATLKSLKYGSTEIELQAGVYEYNIDLAAATVDVPALTAVPSNPNATASVTNADAFDGDGKATSKVVVTPEKDGATTQTYTVNFSKLAALPLLNVDNSIVWDFDNAGTQNNAFTDEVLANFPGVINDATFSAQTLKASGAKITGGYLQGTPILFHATKDGLLRVEFSNTGSSARPYRYLVVNGVRTAYKSNNTTHITTAWIEVSAGDVTIEGECVADENGECTSNNLNFYKIEFLALGHRREASWIVPNELGTVCLKDECIIKGAELYELQGPDANRKLVFDEILSGELEAGKPYLFNATATGRISFYNKVNAAHTETAGSLNGMYGTFEDLTFSPATDQNIYYFSGHNIWAVKKNTADVVLPAYLCYVKMDEFLASPVPDANPAPGRRRVTLGVNGQQVATGVDQVQGDEVPTKMIINGQLFILRGEKMYDAQGKLVK